MTNHNSNVRLTFRRAFEFFVLWTSTVLPMPAAMIGMIREDG